MDEKEKQHHKNKIVLRIIGIILLIAGVTCAIFGFTDMSKAFQESRMPKIWLMFLGFPMIAIGMFMTVVSFQRSINRFIKNENVPVINEMGREISPALSSMANSVKSGLEQTVCSQCGELNDKDAMFCKSCGKPLMLVCDDCGEANESDAKFCKKCGKPLN